MQGGFLLLEGGRVRSKNSINVAQKNVADLMIAWIAYFLIGFLLMYGIAMPVSGEGTPSPLHFLFQLGFCATAASIVSGGVAERFKFVPYLILAFLIGGLLYPLAGRLVWGNTFTDSPYTLLADIGFVDFAGATVVHSLGAWSALVAILMIGPRADRFDDEGKPRSLSSHSSVMSLQGTLLLAFGWIGFNAGTVSIHDPLLQEIVVNTLSAAAFGALGGAIIGAVCDKGVFNPTRTINGLLGGLVTSTAAVHVMHPYEAMLFGFLGGMLATGAAEYLLQRLKLDDPVDVIATHGACGLFGTLLFAFVAPVELLVNGSRVHQFGVQLGGATTIFALVVGPTFLVLKIVSRFTALRVTREEELIGLNYSEHGEAIGTDRLKRALEYELSSDRAFTSPVTIDDHDEHAELANTVNKLIAKHEQAVEKISQSEKRFQQFANTASDWLWECSSDLILTSIYKTNNAQSHHDAEHWIGKHLFDALTFDCEARHTIETAVTNQHSFGPVDGLILSTQHSPLSEQHDTDNTLFVEIRGAYFVDTTTGVIGYRGTISDFTARKRAENQAIFLSMHDELTGLPNRRALQTTLTQMLKNALEARSRVAVVSIDLDGFKSVNDSYGHAAGDALLCTIAGRFLQGLSEYSAIYRTGGDEFVLVIQGLEEDTIQTTVNTISEQMLMGIHQPVSLGGRSAHIEASLGVAVFPEHGASSTELLRRSDLAMYEAKRRGKSQTVWFESTLDNELDHYFKIESELKRAIKDQELFLEYQPIVDTRSGAIKCFEALVRWQHPTQGLIPPFQFIPSIEKNNLMTILGDYVLDVACEFASTWAGLYIQMEPPRIAVNISPSQLVSEHFTHAVIDTLRRHELSPSQLELEITEEALIDGFDRVMSVITSLQDVGVHFSIDDFGTGQTSLRYLSKFPVNTMKMDRSFICNIGKDKRATEITRSIIAMGSRLGYSVVAEGIEEQQQLDILREWNCPLAQGYLISKPVSESTAVAMLKKHGRDHLRKAS